MLIVKKYKTFKATLKKSAAETAEETASASSLTSWQLTKSRNRAVSAIAKTLNATYFET